MGMSLTSLVTTQRDAVCCLLLGGARPAKDAWSRARGNGRPNHPEHLVVHLRAATLKDGQGLL